MTLCILVLFNVIMGFIFREFIYKCRNWEQPSKYILFRRLLQYIVSSLVVISYIAHMLFILQEEYKFSLCMLLVSLSTFNALNQIAYSKKDI